MSESMFRGGEPSWANACVGKNGQPGYFEYSKGYSRAANILLIAVSKSKDSELCDELIYPICFNMRHSVELRFKYILTIVDVLSRMTGKVDLHGLNLNKIHAIETLWLKLDSLLTKFDCRFEDVLRSLENSVLELAKMDPNGQVFRYPYGQDREKHLADAGGVINLIRLGWCFERLEYFLDELYRILNFVHEEYSLGTYTSKFSRSEIYNISRELPEYSVWGEPSFKDVKERLQVKYGTSNKKLSSAFDIIKKHYQFSGFIGLDVKLLGLNEQLLMSLIDAFIEESPQVKTPISHRKGEIISSSDISFDFEAVSLRRSRLRKLCELNSTPEVVSGVCALFYLQRDGDYSEYYVSRYNDELKYLNRCEHSILVDEIFHVMSKSNFLDGVLMSLYILNKIDLISKIIEKFDLSGCVFVEDKIEDILLPSYEEQFGYV